MNVNSVDDRTPNRLITSLGDRVLGYRPPRIAMALLAIAASLHLLMPVLGNTELSSVTVAITAGILGFVVMLSAWWQFRKHQVAICPTDATDHLISDGVYRLTRNPMYLGMILMMFGVAIFFGTVLFFAAAIVYFAIINWFFCPYEEDKLTREFGREFESYRARVRRWL